MDYSLACILHEGNETQGKSGKQGRAIARRPIAVAMGQGGSFEIGRQIFPEFVQAQTVMQYVYVTHINAIVFNGLSP
jgi:hypothetical protein